MRYLVRYRFTRPSEKVSGTDTGDVVGVYRTANSIEEAYEAERAMWECWGAEIVFVEGKEVR
jgi:hypothetical protein